MNKFSDMLARVGEGDVVQFFGIEPDFAFAAVEKACGQPFVKLKRGGHGF